MWRMKFYSFAIDLDPMNLVLKLDLDIVMINVWVLKKVPGSVIQKF